MSPTRTDFGFTQSVPTAGFRWVGVRSLRIFKTRRGEGPEVEPKFSKTERFLIERPRVEGDHHHVERSPDPVLLRRFGDLKADDTDAILAFANENGRLGDRWALYCDPTGQAQGDPFAVEVETSDGRDALFIFAEPLSSWTGSIARMHVALAVFDAWRASDRKALQRHLQWRADLIGRDVWHIDGQVVHGCESRFTDVLVVAATWLAQVAAAELNGRASPRLDVDAAGRITEWLEPSSLLACMWCELYKSIAGDTTYRRCLHCGGYFKITPGETEFRKSRIYCAGACRTRACRRRQEQAPVNKRKRAK